MAQYDDAGREIPDPKPLRATVKTRPAESIDDRIRRILLSQQLAQAAASEGFETPEEADDFDIADDDTWDPYTPYEIDFDHITDDHASEAYGEAMAQEEPASPTTPETVSETTVEHPETANPSTENR